MSFDGQDAETSTTRSIYFAQFYFAGHLKSFRTFEMDISIISTCEYFMTYVG